VQNSLISDLTGYRESGSSVGNKIQDFIRGTCEKFSFLDQSKSRKNLSRRRTKLHVVIEHMNMRQLQKGVLADWNSNSELILVQMFNDDISVLFSFLYKKIL
jgi:hypothetical protein